MPANVPLTEDFTSTNWGRYSIPKASTDGVGLGRQASSVYPWGLDTLDHIDLRTFAPNPSENWTISPSTAYSGTLWVGPNATYNYWSMIEVTYTSGNLVIQSVANPVDLTVLDDSNATLQLALPNCPAVIDLYTTYLELSSDGFNNSLLSLPWSTAATLPVSGFDTHIGFSYSQLTGIDLTKVNGVRFRINASSGGLYNLAALRLIGSQWKQPSVDFDTWNGVLRQSISLSSTVDEPVPPNQSIPPVWFAASTGGTDDPQPINGTFGVLFNTGYNHGNNSFGLNMRAVGGTDTSQLLIQGKTQAQLNGPQPGLIGTAEIPRSMADFEGLTMEEMSQSMLNLEAVATAVSTTWLNFTVQWGSNPLISVGNSLGVNNYSWVGSSLPTLNITTVYLAVLKLTDNTVRIQIFNIVDQTKLVPTPGSVPIFDSGTITDSYQFIRRPGRIGWQASLADGNASILSIRPTSLTFAEYESVALNSNTPVAGARLYAHSSPSLQLWQSFSPHTVDNGPVISTDNNRTITGSSTKVYINDPSVGQGIISNVLSPDSFSGITDMANVVINLSVWFPSSALPMPEMGMLSISLLSQYGAVTPLNVPSITPDQWQSITFNAPPMLQSGLYQLIITYTGSSTATFWVDAVSVEQRIVTWSARANPTDSWTPFNDIVNTDNGGVVFAHKGTQLQVRAQAHQQGAVIMSAPKIVPVYAKPGKFLWPEDQAKFTDPYLGQLTQVPFPTTPILDNFNRSENPLSDGGAWDIVAGPNAVPPGKTNWSQALSTQVTNVYSGSAWNTAVSMPVEVYMDTPVIPDQSGIGYSLQISWYNTPGGASPNGYLLFLTTLHGGSWNIARVDSGVWTLIAGGTPTSVGSPFPWVNGDSVGMTITTAGVITFWHRNLLIPWTAVGTATDTTYSLPGYIGWSTDASATLIDNFGGGTTISSHTTANLTSAFTYTNSSRLYTFTSQPSSQTTNLVPNPSFEYDTVGSPPAVWSTSVPSTLAGIMYAGAAATVQTSAGAASGANAMRVVTTATTGEGAVISLGAFPVGVYTVTAWIKGTTGTEALMIVGAAGAGYTEQNLTATMGWVQQAFSFSSDGGTPMTIAFLSTAAAAVTFFVDAVMVSPGFNQYTIYRQPPAYPYFDGDSPGYQWTGTKGNSTSIPDYPGGVTNCVWSISDGTVVNGSTITHQFPLSAPTNTLYNVTLSVTDVFGGQATSTQTLTVA